MAGGNSSAWALAIELKQSDLQWQYLADGRLDELEARLALVQATGTDPGAPTDDPGEPEQ